MIFPSRLAYITPVVALVTAISLPAAEVPKNENTSSPECSCCSINPETETKSYALQGVVQKVLKDRGALLIKHEEIPGFMKAMTMMFEVDDQLLRRIQIDDKVRGQMTQTASGAWRLDEVEILNS